MVRHAVLFVLLLEVLGQSCAYFYGASMIIALIWIIVQTRCDKKELERQIATGELL
jgi:hypothetical protein